MAGGRPLHCRRPADGGCASGAEGPRFRRQAGDRGLCNPRNRSPLIQDGASRPDHSSRRPTRREQKRGQTSERLSQAPTTASQSTSHPQSNFRRSFRRARPVPIRGGVHVVQDAQQGDASAGEVDQRVGQRELAGPAHRGERSLGTARRHRHQPIAAVRRRPKGGLGAAKGAEGCTSSSGPASGMSQPMIAHAAVAEPPEDAMHADAEIAHSPARGAAPGQAGGTGRGPA